MSYPAGLREDFITPLNRKAATVGKYGVDSAGVTWEEGRAIALEAGAILGCERPYEALRECTTQGHINAMVDSDGVLRHALLYVDVDGEKLPSMAFQAASLLPELVLMP